MAFKYLIQEKKAKEIIGYVLPLAKSLGIEAEFITLAYFVKDGETVIPNSVLELIAEWNKLNKASKNGKPTIRFNYDDCVRVRNYFEQFIPTQMQALVMQHYGLAKITDHNNRFAGK